MHCSTIVAARRRTSSRLPPTTGRSSTSTVARYPRSTWSRSRLILLASVVLVRALSAARSARCRPYLDLFFMGAAFLLLETQERRAVRAAVRHHLVRQRAGVLRASCWPCCWRWRCRGTCSLPPARLLYAALLAGADRGLGGAARIAAVAVAAAPPRAGASASPSRRLPGQPRLRAAVPRYGVSTVPSAPTCWARWSAACSNTPRSLSGTDGSSS